MKGRGASALVGVRVAATERAGAKMSVSLRFKPAFSRSIRRVRVTKPVVSTPPTLRDTPQSDVEGSGQRKDMGFGGQERRGHFPPLAAAYITLPVRDGGW